MAKIIIKESVHDIFKSHGYEKTDNGDHCIYSNNGPVKYKVTKDNKVKSLGPQGDESDIHPSTLDRELRG